MKYARPARRARQERVFVKRTGSPPSRRLRGDDKSAGVRARWLMPAGAEHQLGGVGAVPVGGADEATAVAAFAIDQDAGRQARDVERLLRVHRGIDEDLEIVDAVFGK